LDSIRQLECLGIFYVEHRGSGRANRYSLALQSAVKSTTRQAEKRCENHSASARKNTALRKVQRSENQNSGALKTIAQALGKSVLNQTDQLNQTHSKRGRSAKRFVKPSAGEVSEYARTIGFALDGQQFIDFYESKGWLVGKTRMKDWRAGVRTWKHRSKDNERAGISQNERPAERQRGSRSKPRRNLAALPESAYGTTVEA
jgi:hypothetical protein